MKVIFLGPPGSGKGTQAKLLSDEKKTIHISMGDMLREAIKSGSEAGMKLENYLKNGQLVPDEVVNDIVKQFISGAGGSGFILDGYPRSVRQAEFLSTITDIYGVIFIDVPKEEIINRLKGRMRQDDNEETIRKRFEVYENETKPLIEYYSNKIKRIQGVGSLAEVFEAVKAAA